MMSSTLLHMAMFAQVSELPLLAASLALPVRLRVLTGSRKSGYGVSSTPNITAGQDYTIDEDCLNINIIRPSGTSSDDQLPVLFWIYGGE